MEHITIKLTVTVAVEHIDTQLFAWIEELQDKAREQGEIVSCDLANLPPTIKLGG